MTAYLSPYLNWRGRAREAMEFYHSVFGGQLDVMTFADMGGTAMGVAEDEVDWVMHSALTVSESFVLMGADHPRHVPGEPVPAQVSLAGGADDEDTLRGWWTGLADGATIHEELTRAPWGDTFGMLVDRFGTNWLMNIGGAAPAE